MDRTVTAVRSNSGPLPLAGDAVESCQSYIAAGGGTGIANALALGPAEVLSEVKKARLRGRGGGGFATGIKWASVARRHFTARAALRGPSPLARGRWYAGTSWLENNGHTH
jgi:hypothetical protein